MADPLVPMWDFVVEGTGVFPMPMLSRDACWPRDEAETGAMTAATMPRSSRHTEPYQIHLRGLVEPTVGRWRSFGWRVLPESVARAGCLWRLR